MDTTLPSHIWKFRLGSKIFCADGEYGILAQVILDPTTFCLTHIGVKVRYGFRNIRYLPFHTVIETTDNSLLLSSKRREASAASTAVEGAALGTKCIIEDPDIAAKGTLLLIAVEPECGTTAYLVVRHLRPEQDILLLREYMRVVATERVTLALSRASLESLPSYRSDTVLQREVEARVYNCIPFHIDLQGMNIHVLDGALYLDGNISSLLRSEMVQNQVLNIPGIRAIKNCLIGDDTLAADLAMALGKDSRTRNVPIGVYPHLGIVRLSGTVRSKQQKAAAEEIIRTFAGVRSVINDVRIDPHTDMLILHGLSSTGTVEDISPGTYTRHTK